MERNHTNLQLDSKSKTENATIKKYSNLFENIISSKEVILFDKKFQLDSCFFMEKYIRDYFSKEITEIQSHYSQQINSLNKNAEDIYSHLRIYTTQHVMNVLSVIEDFIEHIGVDNKIFEELKILYKENVDLLQEDLKEIWALFKAIDNEVEISQLEGQLKKVLRGRWMFSAENPKQMVGAFVADKVVNGAYGLFYDAINGVSSAREKHKATIKKSKLVSPVLKMVNKYFDILKNNIPVMIIALIYEKYPYSIWIHNEEQEKALFEKCEITINNSDLQENNLDLFMELILENPYSEKNYTFVFFEIQKIKDISKQRTYINQLLEIAEIFGRTTRSNVKKHLFYSASSAIVGNEELACEKLHDLEILFNAKYPEIQKNIYEKYLDFFIENNLIDYNTSEIQSLIEFLVSFNEKYEYSTYDNISKIQALVLKKYNIDLSSKNINQIENNIKQLKYLNSIPSWDLSTNILEQEKLLSNILKEKDIESRTVEIIDSFNITENEFKTKVIIADSIETKEKIKLHVPLIIEECKKINFDLEKSDLDKIIQKILNSFDKNAYSKTFIEAIQQEWNSNDCKNRTLNGITYNSKTDYLNAQSEINFIENCYSNNKHSLTKKYLTILNKNFESISAQKMRENKEKALIDHIKNLRQKTIAPKKKIVKAPDIIGAIISLGLGAFLLLKVSGQLIWLWKILGIIFILGGPSNLIDSFKKQHQANKKLNNSKLEYKKELEEFYSVFKIENNKILLK